MHTRIYLGCLAATLAMAGCGDDDGMTTPDAGMGADAGPGMDSGPMEVDSGPGDDAGTGGEASCAMPRELTLEMGEQTLTGDTSGLGSDETLSEGCGSEPAPQEVLELTIPGTGQKGVLFNLVNDATAFDTVVEVRTGACDSTDGAMCFDDAFPGLIVQSAGRFVVEGGSTVYLIVTGFDAAAAGPWEMAVEVADAQPPTISGGDARRVETTRYDFQIMGGDPDGDAIGILVEFLADDGTVIGVDRDEDPATPDQTEFFAGFVDDLEGETTFDATARLEDEALVTATASATQVRARVVDRFELESDTTDLAITDVTESGRGETCGATAVCADGYDCIGGTCQIPTETVTACTGATMIPITPGASTVTETRTGSVEPGPSYLRATCGDTSGPEVLYRVAVPATGTYDLIASTDNAATGAADTVVHVQSDCGDPASEVACDDDGGEEFRSVAVVEAAPTGTYTIAVEIYGGPEAATPFELDVSLRPVLEAGAACDPAGEMNRCATGDCPSSGDAVCPPAT